MSKRVKIHLLFCLVTLMLLMMQPLVEWRGAIFGYILLLSSVYLGRWISGQSHTATWFDMFRMFFLSFFCLTVGGVAGFARYVEPGLRITHYFESWINISVLTTVFLFAGFFVSRIRANHRKNFNTKIL